MTRHNHRTPILLLAASALIAASLACGPVAAPTATPAPTDTPAPTNTPLPPTNTPPPPATDTPVPPTATPRPTATPTPGPGDVIYKTEFDDATGWSSLTLQDGGKFTAESRNGKLYVEVNSKDTYAYVFSDIDFGYSDVQIKADVETVSGPNRNNISLVCRATDNGWYEFNIFSGGLYNILRFDSGKGWTALATGGSKAINLQKAKNNLVAICQGNQLTFIINDTKVASVRDSTYTGGVVGVSVSTFDIAGAGVEFDRLIVSLP